MDKIWIIKSGSRYQKKFTIYKEESKLLKAISKDRTATILEYDLVSKVTSEDYLVSKERDSQLKSVLGELSDKEQAVIDFVNLYENIAPTGKKFKKRISWHESVETSTKEQMLLKLRKFQTEPKELAKIIVNNKKYFINDVSRTTEWYLSLLKVHNFRNHITSRRIWDRNEKKYIIEDNSPDEIRDNFKQAKSKLRKIKSKK